MGTACRPLPILRLPSILGCGRLARISALQILFLFLLQEKNLQGTYPVHRG